jgi:hypothetical protein
MLYFIPWAVFFLVVISAVPIASFLEKRKYPKPKSEPKSVGDDDGSGESAESDEPAADADEAFGTPADGEVAEVQFDAPGGDDFSAFDDDFK